MTNAIEWGTIRQNCTDQIQTCHLIETRMVDFYVLADPDTGHCLATEGGLKPFMDRLDIFEKTREKDKILGLKAHVREQNPDNSVAQRLVIMGWKKAARIQRGIAEDLLNRIDSMTSVDV